MALPMSVQLAIDFASLQVVKLQLFGFTLCLHGLLRLLGCKCLVVLTLSNKKRPLSIAGMMDAG